MSYIVLYIVQIIVCRVQRILHKTGLELVRSFQQYNR